MCVCVCVGGGCYGMEGQVHALFLLMLSDDITRPAGDVFPTNIYALSKRQFLNDMC